MNDLEISGIIDSLEKVNLPADLREGLLLVCQELQTIADGYLLAAEKIHNDPRFTKIGKRERLQTLGGEVWMKLPEYKDPFSKNIEQAKRKIDTADGEKKKSDSEILRSYLEGMELRSAMKLYAKDATELEAELSNPLVLDAILGSPLPLLPKERLEELKAQRLEAVNPEAAQQLDEFRYANETVQSILRSIQGSLKADGYQNEGMSPLEKMAQRSKGE